MLVLVECVDAMLLCYSIQACSYWLLFYTVSALILPQFFLCYSDTGKIKSEYGCYQVSPEQLQTLPPNVPPKFPYNRYTVTAPVI